MTGTATDIEMAEMAVKRARDACKRAIEGMEDRIVEAKRGLEPDRTMFDCAVSFDHAGHNMHVEAAALQKASARLEAHDAWLRHLRGETND